MTARDLITAAYRLAGVTVRGETPTSDELIDGLDALNTMLDGWNAERLAVFTTQRQVFNLTAGKQAYTLGAGGDFNVSRPARVERAGIISLNNPLQPLELAIQMLNDADWSQIPVKNITSSLPQKVWDDGGFPLRTLSYWCIPSVSVQTALYTWTALTQFPDLVTDETFPPGYAEALRYNLAIRLAVDSGKQVPPDVAAIAMQTKGRVKSLNAPLVDLKGDAGLVVPSRRIYNWLTDGPRNG